jgi:hypothetical protein
LNKKSVPVLHKAGKKGARDSSIEDGNRKFALPLAMSTAPQKNTSFLLKHLRCALLLFFMIQIQIMGWLSVPIFQYITENLFIIGEFVTKTEMQIFNFAPLRAKKKRKAEKGCRNYYHAFIYIFVHMQTAWILEEAQVNFSNKF